MRNPSDRAIDDEYIDAYTRMPQTDDELVPLVAQHLDEADDWAAIDC